MPRPKGSKNKPKQVPETTPVKPNSQPEKTPDFEFRNGDYVTSNIEEFKLDHTYTKLVSDALKVKCNRTNSTMVVNTDVDSSFRLFQYNYNNELSFEDNYWLGKNGRLMRPDEEGFQGGSAEDIIDSMNGKFNHKEFLKKRDQMKKTFSKLQELEATITRKRNRNMSEHDGELDFDRLYERNPFHSTKYSNNGIARTMDINVDFSFSAAVKNYEINEFGVTVWSIINILENSGIQCNVNLINTYSGLHSYNNKGYSPRSVKIITNIKKAGDYIDTMDIARCFTSNYYRRVGFTIAASLCAAAEVPPSWGLGSSYYYKSKIENKKGELNFKIEQMSNFKLNQDELIKFIKEAL
jgi:hypothetical protein